MLNIPPEDLIRTLGSEGHSKVRIKGSRFIGLAAPASTREEAGKIIRAEEKKYHAAAHHCWGWRSLEHAETAFAYDDDGEPSGTAGAPILKAIESEGLVGVVVVVTRYFGGVKLGTGPLARAYSQAAAKAMASAVKTEGMFGASYSLTLEYPFLGRVNKLIETGPVVVISRNFEENVGLKIAVATSRAEAFISLLTETTGGRIGIEPLGVRPVFQD